jgi:hypothetical protein
LLAAKTDALPSILAYTQEEWESRKRSGSSFRQAVERDAVRFFLKRTQKSTNESLRQDLVTLGVAI